MQRLRKVVSTRACLQIAAGFKKAPTQTRNFSAWMTDSAGIPQEKPKNDGYQYIGNNIERARDEIIDKEFERVLNEPSTNEQRQALEQLLGKDFFIFNIFNSMP